MKRKVEKFLCSAYNATNNSGAGNSGNILCRLSFVSRAEVAFKCIICYACVLLVFKKPSGCLDIMTGYIYGY